MWVWEWAMFEQRIRPLTLVYPMRSWSCIDTIVIKQQVWEYLFVRFSIWMRKIPANFCHLLDQPNLDWNSQGLALLWLVVWNIFIHFFYFSIILGISWSQLTNPYFSEGLKPPTSTVVCQNVYIILTCLNKMNHDLTVNLRKYIITFRALSSIYTLW